MTRSRVGAIACALAAASCTPHSRPSPHPEGGVRLTPFTSWAEAERYLKLPEPPAPRTAPPVTPASPLPATIPVAPPPTTSECNVVPGDSSRSVGGRTLAAESGLPLPGAIVRVGTRPAARADGAGAFRVDSLPVGRHPVTVALLGRSTASCTAEIAAGLGSRVEVRLGVSAVSLEGIVVTAQGTERPRSSLGTSTAGVSVTNVQHQGVDEGGIVKLHGEHLVILRRGRLFTVRVGDRRLRAVDVENAYGPGIDPEAWYDEMLVSEDRVVVIGYSYRRGGTEVGLFAIDSAGGLSHRSTHHLRSDDYYSSRNYASRLVNGRLVFYTPSRVEGEAMRRALPALRRWHEEGGRGGFRPIGTVTRIYRAAGEDGPEYGVTLHTVVSCDLANDDLDCESTAVLAGRGRTFYVSPTAAYVWTSGNRTSRADATLYRIPLDGSRPSAVGATGSPIDQFSFLEAEGRLSVLVRTGGSPGDWMWEGERRHTGTLALLRLPLDRFGDGSTSAGRADYRVLPDPGTLGTLQNRFVGGHLLYGVGAGWNAPGHGPRAVHVVPLDGGAPRRVKVDHGIDRIERMGGGAVVIGGRGQDLHFTGLHLDRWPRVAHRYVRPGASQGETRSHGFFYREDDDLTGVLGLPIRGGGQPGHHHLLHGSASIVYLRNDGSAFTPLGELAAREGAARGDHCRVSCVDWYGNARPLFIGERVFALLGYELVEGRIGAGTIREVSRLDYTPRSRLARGD